VGHVTRFRHDALGNATARVDPLGHVTTREYDRKSRLTKTVLPSGAMIEYAYDADDNLIRHVDEIGTVTYLEYFGQGEIKRLIRSDGHCVEYHYDSEEQLVGVTNQRGETCHLERDALGRVVRETDYWGQARCYSYDAGSRLQRSIDPLGRVIEYTTDPLGRVRSKTLPHPERPNETFAESFEFDAAGNLIRAANPHVIVTRRFDDLGRLVEEAQGAFVVRNSYDQNGNRVQRETSAGGVISYEYDALDRVRMVRIDDESLVRIERDACGQITRELLGPHLVRDYRYGHDGLMTSQAIRCGERWLATAEFGYDPADNLTQRRDGEYGTDRYRYDPMGYLREHNDPRGGLTRFLNDPAGDRLTTRIVQGAGQPASGEHARSAGSWRRKGHYQGTDYSFDRAGNLVWRGDGERATRYFWSADQCLIRSDTDGVSTRYAYDPLARRVLKDTDGRGAWFGWDGDALMAVGDARLTDADGTQRQEYIYYPGTFTPLAVVGTGSNGKEALYFHNDPNGCPTRLVDKEGETVWLARPSPLGGIDQLLVERVPNPIRLQGQYEDEETGLSYNRYRYFDSHLGQYVSQDPLRLAASDNLYEMAPNCFKFADPLGLRCYRLRSEGNRTIIEIFDNPAFSAAQSAELADFVRAWNRVIARNGGQMSRRQNPLSKHEEKYHASWRATMRAQNPATYPNSSIVVGHVPDAAMGGPVAHNRWGNTVGETMPLHESVNSYVSNITNIAPGTTYHEVRLI
jgi:RHS repeat-associated protein